MTEVEVTWNRLSRVWWLFAWRSALAGLAVGFVAGFVIGVVTAQAGIDEKTARLMTLLVTPVFGLLASVFVFRSAFRKNFQGFRLAMIQA